MEAQFKAAVVEMQKTMEAAGLRRVIACSDGANSPILSFTSKRMGYVETDAAVVQAVYLALRGFTGVRREADKWVLTVDRFGGAVTGAINNQALRLFV